MKHRNDEARGLQQMNRTPGVACAMSGRPGSMRDKRRKPRSAEKAAFRKEMN